jgi:hypothetical protein
MKGGEEDELQAIDEHFQETALTIMHCQHDNGFRLFQRTFVSCRIYGNSDMFCILPLIIHK